MKSSDSSSAQAMSTAPAQKTPDVDRQSSAWAKAGGLVAESAAPTSVPAPKGRGRKKGSPEDQQDELNNQLLAVADTSTQATSTAIPTESEGDRRTSGYSTSNTSTVTANKDSDDRPAEIWAKQDTYKSAGWGDSTLYGLLGGGLALGLSAGGGGSKSNGTPASPTGGGVTTASVSLRASDSSGIKNANVYAIDANGKEVLIGSTGDDGRLQIENTNFNTLVLKGGTNISTELPNKLEMKVISTGLDKQLAINPITTLVAAVFEASISNEDKDDDLTPQEAEDAVKSKLGIGSSIDLQTFDPLDASLAGKESALKFIKIEAQLSAAIGSAALGEDFLQALAQYIFDGKPPINLSSETDLQAVLGTPSSSQLMEIKDVANNNAQVNGQVSIQDVQAAYRAGLAPVILGLKNDTGDSDSDKKTTDPRLVVSGVNTGSTIEYSVDDITWTSEVKPSGQGPVSVRARLAYVNGSITNYSDVSDNFTFEYKDPKVPTTAPELSLLKDSGISAADQVSNKGELVLSNQLPDTFVEYSLDGGDTWQPEFEATEDGLYEVSVRQTYDGRGADEASPSSLFKFKLDTTATVGTAGLAANVKDALENDTGGTDFNDNKIDVTFSDGITSDTTPILAGKTEAGASSVTVEVAGHTYQVAASNLLPDGSWTLQLPQALADGAYKPTVTVVDQAGNTSHAVFDAFTIDTIAPPELDPEAGDVTAVLSIATDSYLPGDFITNNARPVLTGTTEPNAYVLVQIGDQVLSGVADDAGLWSVSVVNPLPGDVYPTSIKVIDGAGNETEYAGPEITIDLSPPEIITQAHLLDEEEVDTGADSADGITSIKLPTIVGEVDEGTFVSAILNGRIYAVAAVDGDWSFKVPEEEELDDGTYTVTIVYSDAAGNTIGEQSVPFTIDTEAASFDEFDLARDEDNDTGIDQEDGITNNDSPVFRGMVTLRDDGTLEPGLIVRVTIDGEEYETDEIADDGSWELTVVGLDDGDYEPIIQVIDLAGNVSDEETVTLTVDTVLPESTAELVHDEENDTGDPDDNITSNTLPLISGDTEALAHVVLEVGGFTYETDADDEGHWEIQVEDELDAGEHTPIITVTDLAGNVFEEGEGTSFEVTDGPDLSVGTAEFVHDTDNDTGNDSEDGITSNNSPTFVGTGSPGATVQMDFDGDVFTAVVDENGDWELTAEGLADGQYTPVITMADEDGNEGDPLDIEITITIDTEAPSSADPAAELIHDEENDTGVEDNVDAFEDNITSNITPTLFGDIEEAPNATLTLLLRNTTTDEEVEISDIEVNEDGHWEYTVDSELTDGDYEVAIIVTDAAGNVSEELAGTPFTVVTSVELTDPVTGGLVHDADNDTGIDEFDGNTQNDSPTLEGAGGVPGSTVKVDLDGDSFYGEVAEDGTWSVDTSGLVDGPYTPIITFLDIAGNESEPTNGDEFTVDTTPPDEGEITAALTTGEDNDTGLADDDGITSVKAPLLSGTAEPFAQIMVDIGVGDPYYAEADEFGEWQIALDELEDGQDYLPTITVTDAAGNETTIDGTPFTIDSEAPSSADPAAELIHDADNDTGVEDNVDTFEDNITSNTTPTLFGDIEDAPNATLTLVLRNTTTDEEFKFTDVEVGDDGHWEYTVDSELTDGDYEVAIIVTDVAGNESEELGGTPFTVITNIEVSGLVTGGLVHDADNDTGLVDFDNFTQNDSPLLEGKGGVPGLTVRVELDGEFFFGEVAEDGSWTVETSGLADNEYTPIITFLDIAGNESESTDGTPFTVDNEAPDDGEAALAIESDTGASNDDGITSISAPILRGTAEPGAQISVDIGVGKPYLAEADLNGDWEVQLDELEDGEDYLPIITVTDAAGNETTFDGTPFTIDTDAPSSADPAAELDHDGGSDSGEDTADNITNVSKPTLFGDIENAPNATLTLILRNTTTDVEIKINDIDVDEDGHWEHTVASNLPDGDYEVAIIVTDAAGNVSKEIIGTPFTLDHTPPAAGTGGLLHEEDNDTGASPDDSYTGNASPVLVGTAEEGATVKVTINGKVEDTVADGGEWEVSFTNLPDGTYTPSISVTDVAGNVTLFQGSNFVVDTSLPNASGVTGGLLHTPGNDTGASAFDSITRTDAPVLQGTAPAFALLVVEVDGTEYRTTANSAGVWQVGPIDSLSDDTYDINITVVDIAGNSSNQIKVGSFTIVTEASGDASGELVHNAANDTGAEIDDGITRNARPTLEGTADAGATVYIDLDNGTLPIRTYTVQATTAGTWSLQVPTALPDGTYTPRVYVNDLAGNTSEPVEGEPIVIDTRVPTASGGLTHDDTSDTGISFTDGITNNNLPTLSGRAEAGAFVTVTLGSLVLEEVQAGDDGVWSVDVSEELANGRYTPSIMATDLAGNTATYAGEAFTVNLTSQTDGFNVGTHQVFIKGKQVSIDLGAGTFDDYAGTLPAGLTLNELTGEITGKATESGFTWIANTTQDAAGNETTIYSQLVVVEIEKQTGSTSTSSTINHSGNTTPLLFTGASSNNSVSLLRSYGDVVLLGEGDDSVSVADPRNLSEGEGSPLDFARLDGGVGTDLVRFAGLGLQIDFADFNNPDGAGKVLQHFETVSLASKEMEITISAGDLFRMQSELLDVDGISHMVRFNAASTSGSSIAIDGLEQVGGDYQFNANGALGVTKTQQIYSKFTGVYEDADGEHLLTLLFSKGIAAA